MVNNHTRLCCLLFLFVSLFCYQCESEEKNENEKSVKAILEQLGISSGQSNRYERDSASSQKANFERLREISDINGKFEDLLVTNPVSSFEAKHLFKWSERTNNSFDKITQSSIAMKRYLIDLNLKLFNVVVLPKTVEKIEDSTTIRKWNILNTDMNKLKDDLEDSKKGGPVQTKNKYRQTQMTFKRGKNKRLDACGVTVEEKLKLFLNPKTGELNIVENGTQFPAKSSVCTSFTEADLQTSSDIKAKLFKDLHLPPALEMEEKDIILNENSAWYKEKMKRHWEQLEDLVINPISKRATDLRDLKSTCYSHNEGVNCAVKIDKESDNVVSIYGNEFLIVFESSSNAEKRQLTQVVRVNMEKIVLSSRDQERMGSQGKAAKELEIVKRKIEAIFVLGEFKSHTNTVHDVSQIQNLDGKKDWTTSKYLESISSLESAKVTMSKSRVAEGIANSRSFKNYKSSNFLASTEIVGVNRGDDTSWSNVEKRLGYAESESSVEERHIQEKTKVLGRMTRAIGSTQDNIGYNIYSFSKNVERLAMSKDEHDQSDAIAEIFTQALDIGTFSGVVVVSVSFPLSAPVAITTGAVIIGLTRVVTTLVKTGNEVSRIHSEISLSFSEGLKIFWSRLKGIISGQRKRDYIDNLVAEKRANDLAVEDNLKFLQDNEDTIRGIVFPSMEYKYDGGCTLTKQRCVPVNTSLSDKNKLCFGEVPTELVENGCDFNVSCTPDNNICDNDNNTGCLIKKERCAPENESFSETSKSCMLEDLIEPVGNGCDFNDSCPTDNDLCNNYTKDNYQYTCQCTEKADFVFENKPKLSSFVNLRDKGTKLYWERTAPKNVDNGEFICKPGQRNFKNSLTQTDEKMGEYYCSNAIGLVQPKSKRRDGQAMIIDLGDGPDTVIMDPENNTTNIFRMGQCGIKKFSGGGGKNEFVFETEVCSQNFRAKLEGGDSKEDTITLTSDFKRGKRLSVDLEKGSVMSSDNIGSILVSYQSVETLVGRAGESEVVSANCSTINIALRGGNSQNYDELIVPKDEKCDYNLTIVMNEYSHLKCSGENGEITVLVENNPESSDQLVRATFNIYPNATTKLNLIFLKVSSRHLVNKLIVSEQTVTLLLKRTFEKEKVDIADIKFRGQNLSLNEMERNLSVYFSEDPPDSPFSVMRMSTDKSQATVVHHLLPLCNNNSSSLERYGSEAYGNVFDVSGSCWKVYGGKRNDEFLLYVQPLELHGGGNMDDDTIRIDSQINEDVSIILDLESEKFSGIENVIGTQFKNLEVTCGCDTKLVVLMGTQFPKNPNMAIIPSCETRVHSPLQVIVRGYSIVKVVGAVENFEHDGVGVVAISSTRGSPPLKFEFEGGRESLKGLQLSFKLQHKNWTVVGMETRGSEIFALLHGSETYLDETIQLKFETSNSQNIFGSLLKFPYIYVLDGRDDTPTGQFILDFEMGDLKVMYSLEEDGKGTSVQGILGISNIFRVMNPSWKIHGGRFDDLFYVDESAVKGTHINGGGGENNILILQSGSNPHKTVFEVDLVKGQFGFISKRHPLKGTLSLVHQVIGRPNLPDTIRTTCSTKKVNGSGGLSMELQDVIQISGINCTNLMHMTVDMSTKYTHVKNEAIEGSFIYYVGDLASSTLELKISEQNKHTIVYLYHPWLIIKSLYLENKNKSLSILFKVAGGGVHKKTFTLAQPDNATGEYTNPLIKFHHKSRSSISTDIRVSKDSGIISATIFVNGMCLRTTDEILGLAVHINKFLINATFSEEPLYLSGGTIRGSAQSEVNMFWVFQLSNTLDILDGGRIGAKNCLHLAESLFPKTNLEIDLDIERGSILQNNYPLIRKIQNINEFHGRNISTANDTVYVTCHTKSVTQAEFVHVRTDDYPTCASFNLVIELGQNTVVKFLGRESHLQQSSQLTEADIRQHFFHYNFSIARSFDLKRDLKDSLLLSLATHIYYLPIYLDNIKTIQFDWHSERLSYSLFSTNKTYSHYMIETTLYSDQFYQQPVILTKDNFHIQVARTGNVQLSFSSNSTFPSLHYIQNKVIPVFLSTSLRIGATIIVQTASEVLYFDKNVLQNSKSLSSHLVGDSESNTTFVIVSLTKDVYVYAGYEKRKESCEPTRPCPYQTLDLAQIITMIRQSQNDQKFVPSVNQNGTDVVLIMAGYEERFPGKIVIVDGTQDRMRNRLEILLDSTVMHLTKDGDNWKLSPKSATVKLGYTLGISKSDLEENQTISLNSNQPYAKLPLFSLAQNGSNLIITNIKAVRVGKTRNKRDLMSEEMDISQDATTVIITDFYQQQQNSSSTRKTLQVIAKFPGLELLLKGNQVFMRNPNNNTIDDWLPIGAPQEWKCVMHDIEQRLLKELPNVETVYYSSECVDRTMMYASIVVSITIGVIALTFLIIYWKILVGRNKKENERSLEEQVPLHNDLIAMENENICGEECSTGSANDTSCLKDIPSTCTVVARPSYRYIYEDSEIRRLAAERIYGINRL